MDHSLKWLINTDDWGHHVSLSGVINEESDLEQIAKNLDQDKPVSLDLAEVQRINSSGIREWMHFIGPLSEGRKVELINCSPAIVAQLNVFRDFAGTAEVKSFKAPYLCPSCDEQALLDIKVGGDETAPETIPCEACGSEMEFDDIPDCYFAFLRWHTAQD